MATFPLHIFSTVQGGDAERHKVVETMKHPSLASCIQAYPRLERSL